MTQLHPMARWLLWPLSLVYGAAVVTRAWLYRIGIFKQKRLKGVVISVGNLTVGGTGKTPMVMLLAQRLIQQGHKPGILTRGYRSTQFHSSSPESLPLGLDRMSDEIMLYVNRLGTDVSFGIGADRFAKGKLLEHAGVRWFVLDDGFQHQRLARDVDIALVDASDALGKGLLLPAGRLREPAGALGRADVVVITRSEHSPALEVLIRRHTQAPLFYAQPELVSVYPSERSASPATFDDFRGKPLFAFAGIGNPSAFFEDLKRWGLQVAGTRQFSDHRRYGASDGVQIEQCAIRAGAEALISTEKDNVNLGDLKRGDVRFQRLPLFVAQISMKVSEPDRLWDTVQSVIELKRGGKAL